MSTTEIVKAPDSELAREAGSMLDVIARAAADPSVNVDKLERLLAIQQTILVDQRRTAYMAAMARLQEKMPQIAKSGVIHDTKGNVRNKFAKLEDIDVVVRPMLAAEGFSFSYDTRPIPGGNTDYVLTISHREGHSETKSLPLPVDSGPPGRGKVQDAGSSLSYARRYLLMMALNLVTRDVDNDGQGESDVITPAQVAQLREALAATGRNEARFLLALKVGRFEDLAVYKFQPALTLASAPKVSP